MKKKSNTKVFSLLVAIAAFYVEREEEQYDGPELYEN